MGVLFNRLPFPVDSRMTGIGMDPPQPHDERHEVALGQLIALGRDQDPGTEHRFLSGHLPFGVGGFHGLYPDGQGFVVLLQSAPAGAARGLVGIDDDYWPMLDALDRALRVNDQARRVYALRWDRASLLADYADQGIDAGDVVEWSVTDLLGGLLAECCNVSLEDIVAGHARGCAFPAAPHDCTGSAVDDVFARWAAG